MIRGRDIPHYVRISMQKLFEQYSTTIMNLTASYWGISIGTGSRFVGRASLVRCRGSEIAIGPNGRFLSATRANRHGLNRPVMITTLRPGAEIKIGSDVGMSGTVICAAKSVHIGKRVMFGANTIVTDTDSHPIDHRERHAAHFGLAPSLADEATRVAEVVIADDVFVGMHAIIMKGVTIGHGAVIAAGSVVTRDVPAGSIVAGVPAHVVGQAFQSQPN